MLTIAAIEEDVPLLVGRLSLERKPATESYRPFLELAVFCPACRCPHYFDWPDDALSPEIVLVREPPCDRSSFLGDRIAIGIDPELRVDHRVVLVDFKATLRHWRADQRANRSAWVDRETDRQQWIDWPELASQTA
jgi:hypothetical protein